MVWGEHSVKKLRTSLNDLAQRTQDRLLPARKSHFIPFTHAGVTGMYRVYSAGLATDRPIGALFYFDGDYGPERFSHIFKRSGLLMSQLLETARTFNMLLIPVTSPDTTAGTYTTNWWNHSHSNGLWFRELVQVVLRQHPIDLGRIWCAGYSGGAEFLSFELLAHGVQHLAGATMIGGGGVDGVHTAPPGQMSARLFWHVGAKDTGILGGIGWSAFDAAHDGFSFYSQLGAQTSLEVIPGVGHLGYDINRLIARDLEAGFGVQPHASNS